MHMSLIFNSSILLIGTMWHACICSYDHYYDGYMYILFICIYALRRFYEIAHEVKYAKIIEFVESARFAHELFAE